MTPDPQPSIPTWLRARPRVMALKSTAKIGSWFKRKYRKLRATHGTLYAARRLKKTEGLSLHEALMTLGIDPIRVPPPSGRRTSKRVGVPALNPSGSAVGEAHGPHPQDPESALVLLRAPSSRIVAGQGLWAGASPPTFSSTPSGVDVESPAHYNHLIPKGHPPVPQFLRKRTTDK